MNQHNIYRLIPCFLSGLLLVGCATPQAVYDLAEKTAANTSVLSTGLQTLARQNRNIAVQRAAAVARMEQVTSEVRAEYDLDVALTNISGGSKNIDHAKELSDWMQAVRGIDKQPEGVEQQRKEEIVSVFEQVDIKAKELAVVAEKVATLTKQDSARDRVEFFAIFAAEVGKQAKEKVKAAQTAATQAENAITEKPPSSSDLN